MNTSTDSVQIRPEYQGRNRHRRYVCGFSEHVYWMLLGDTPHSDRKQHAFVMVAGFSMEWSNPRDLCDHLVDHALVTWLSYEPPREEVSFPPPPPHVPAPPRAIRSDANSRSLRNAAKVEEGAASTLLDDRYRASPTAEGR
eukprot:8073602-Pyramimonas_sp.AAC.1